MSALVCDVDSKTHGGGGGVGGGEVGRMWIVWRKGGRYCMLYLNKQKNLATAPPRLEKKKVPVSPSLYVRYLNLYSPSYSICSQ